MTPPIARSIRGFVFAALAFTGTIVSAQIVALPYPGPPVGYYPGAFDAAGALRIEVNPRDAEVFLDGYWAGTVDDFDGYFQRLRVRPGEHEIEVYKDGFRSVKQKIFLQPGQTFRLRHTLEKLRPGETPDPRPTPITSPADARREDERGRPPDPRRPDARERRQPIAGYGSIAIRVQPADAEVLIDGERWNGTPGEPLVVELPAGRHRVEIRRPGRQSYSSDVEIRQGQTTTLNVSLRAEGER